MRIIEEIFLEDKYDLEGALWSGALDTIRYLTNDEVKEVLSILEDGYYDEPMELGQLNDFFWFEDDTIAEWLGYNDFEEIMERENDEE